MKQLGLFVVLVTLAISTQAQYKKKSSLIFNRNTRFFTVGTGLSSFKDNKGMKSSFIFGGGNEKSNRKIILFSRIEYLPKLSCDYFSNSTGSLHTTSMKTIFNFGYHLGYKLTKVYKGDENGSKEGSKVIPYVRLGVSGSIPFGTPVTTETDLNGSYGFKEFFSSYTIEPGIGAIYKLSKRIGVMSNISYNHVFSSTPSNLTYLNPLRTNIKIDVGIIFSRNTEYALVENE
jgi:hypothetical protein